MNYTDHADYNNHTKGMKMLKKISAMKVRQSLGQVMNEVSLRGDDYIVERAGKPLVAIIPMEKYQRLQKDREGALQALNGIWQKMENADSKEVESLVNEAVRKTRKAKIKR
jgi:prevent-host-death family protein